MLFALIFIALILPRTRSVHVVQSGKRDLDEVVNDVGSFMRNTLDRAANEFESIGEEIYQQEKIKLEEAVDERCDQKMKAYLGEILLELPDTLTGAEIQSMFHDLIDVLKKNELDKLESLSRDAVGSAKRDMKSAMSLALHSNNKVGNGKDGKKSTNGSAKVQNNSWDLKNIAVEVDAKIEMFKEEIQNKLEKESYAILMSLNHDIKDVKDEFIKAMVSDFDSKYENGDSEDLPSLIDTENIENESDKVDTDVIEKTEIIEINKDSEDAKEEDGIDELVGDASPVGDNTDPELIEFATDAQDMIRSYGEEIISSTTDRLKKDMEELVQSIVHDMLPSATEEEVEEVVEKTIDTEMVFELKELNMGVQVTVDIAEKNIIEATKEDVPPKEIRNIIDERVKKSFEEMDKVTEHISESIMNSAHHDVSHVIEKVINELGIEVGN